MRARNRSACLPACWDIARGTRKGAKRRWEQIRFASASPRPRICCCMVANSCRQSSMNNLNYRLHSERRTYYILYSKQQQQQQQQQKRRLLFQREAVVVVFSMQDSSSSGCSIIFFFHTTLEKWYLNVLCACWKKGRRRRVSLSSNSPRNKAT